ncbi:hypothetical protein ACOME3_002495 [Neoechinorhynchus agilis]
MERYTSLISKLCSKEIQVDLMKRDVNELKSNLQLVFNDFTDFRTSMGLVRQVGLLTDRLISFGAEHLGKMNMLVYNGPRDPVYFDSQGFVPSIWRSDNKSLMSDEIRTTIDTVVNGFQLAMIHGPLCEEEMYGCCIFIEKMDFRAEITDGNDQENAEDVVSDVATSVVESITESMVTSGHYLMMVKNACSNATLEWPQKRLMMAMYRCDIRCDTENLGRLNTVIRQRHGRVVQEDLISSHTFLISITMPVVESFGFVVDAWKRTSGAAMPQLLFSHWELLDGDPLAGDEDGLNEQENESNVGNEDDARAHEYVKSIRARKGLKIREVSIKFAEKQRTLGKNK